jgi:hypothetical protein
MLDCSFSVPVQVRTTTKDGETVEVVESLSAAMTAMSRGRIGAFELDWPGWGLTFEALGRARMDPTPERLEQARQAFCGLAEHSNALVDDGGKTRSGGQG